jgi:hypothetical protein
MDIRIIRAMKPVALLCAFLLISLGLGQSASSDEAGIKATIKNYIEGYYAGDAERVKRALHPMLAKRFVAKKKDGSEVLVDGTAQHMVDLTASQDGPKSYRKDQQRLQIKIFEILNKTASAKATAQDWVDYIHLAKIDGQWVIVNVLWTGVPPPK